MRTRTIAILLLIGMVSMSLTAAPAGAVVPDEGDCHENGQDPDVACDGEYGFFCFFSVKDGALAMCCGPHYDPWCP